MKTAILTIAIFFATVFGISQSTFAATTGNNVVSTMLTDVNTINEIEVHGNVQVYITSGDANQVKVYNDYYAENAMVQDENGVLRITSYNAEKLVVWVTVNDLGKVSAYDDATIKSFGKLSAIDLNVQLFNNASAKLDVDAYVATISINDRAKAELAGNVTESNISYAPSSELNTKALAAIHLVETVQFGRMHHGHRPIEFASL
jgi:phage gp45-like